MRVPVAAGPGTTPSAASEFFARGPHDVHPRTAIEERAQRVAGEREQEDRRHAGEGDALHRGVVAGAGALDQQAAETRQVEHRLDQDGAGKELTGHGPQPSQRGGEGTGKHPAPERGAIREAGGARDDQVWLAERIDGRRSHRAQDRGSDARREHDRRHQHVARGQRGFLVRRDVAARGKPTQQHGEDEDHHQRLPEDRHGRADEGESAADAIDDPALAPRRGHAGGHGDDDRQHQAGGHEMQGDGQALHQDLAGTGRARATELSTQRRREPVEVPRDGRELDAEARAQHVHDFAHARVGRDRLARQCTRQQEDHDARADQQDRQREAPLDQESDHDCAGRRDGAPSCIPPARRFRLRIGSRRSCVADSEVISLFPGRLERLGNIDSLSMLSDTARWAMDVSTTW
jgi:hypothetical protein